MAEFIKAYSELDSTVFEVSVAAASKPIAKIRGVASLLGRRPARVSAIKEVEVVELGDGVIKDYRVIVHIDNSEDIRDMLKLDEARQFFIDKL